MTTHRPAPRTLLPFALLLGGLLGAGPFVPHTFAAVEPAAPAPAVPGLAGILGVALAAAALAGIAIARRRTPAKRTSPDGAADRSGGRTTKSVDPLLAALRGPAAFAPEDLDARLTSAGSTQTQSGADGPVWVRRMYDRRPDQTRRDHDDEPWLELDVTTRP
jgi:hypothetical protein